jgi:hypothetical protein
MQNMSFIKMPPSMAKTENSPPFLIPIHEKIYANRVSIAKAPKITQNFGISSCSLGIVICKIYAAKPTIKVNVVNKMRKRFRLIILNLKQI